MWNGSFEKKKKNILTVFLCWNYFISNIIHYSCAHCDHRYHDEKLRAEKSLRFFWNRITQMLWNMVVSSNNNFETIVDAKRIFIHVRFGHAHILTYYNGYEKCSDIHNMYYAYGPVSSRKKKMINCTVTGVNTF